MPKRNDRFDFFSSEYKGKKLRSNSQIMKDNETGVLYYLYNERSGGGVTVLVDKEGKPLTDEQD